ncbi:hypothetical protein MMMB2_4223 [Mycobacterium marinum MB2]|nr:hypothetical protein MMMB2_4223 [Mycobacterium marinum MB2]
MIWIAECGIARIAVKISSIARQELFDRGFEGLLGVLEGLGRGQ